MAIVRLEETSVRIVVAHLPPGFRADRSRQRYTELEALLGILAEEPTLPTILLGDLNAIAPYDPVDLAAARPDIQSEVAEQGGEVPRDVIERLTTDGWLDAYHHVHPHWPKHTVSTGHPSHRADHIFVDRSLAPSVVDANVETSGFAPYCSDHYPLWAALSRPIERA